nr:unnamed protein product [Digitaria exilis]
MVTAALDANTPPAASPLYPTGCPCIPPCLYCAHICCSCRSSCCFRSISAICTYDGGGTASDAANGSPPTISTVVPSGAGSISTGAAAGGNATLLALPHAACEATCCRTTPWSYIPPRSKVSIPPPSAAVCRERLLAVSTSASSQSAFPFSAAGVCHADVTAAGASSDSDGNATQLLVVVVAGGGAAEKSASASLFSCSSTVAAGSLRGRRDAGVVAPGVEGDEGVNLLGRGHVGLERLDAFRVLHAVEEAVEDGGEHAGDVAVEREALPEQRVERGEHHAACSCEPRRAAREEPVEQVAQLPCSEQEPLGVHVAHRRRRRWRRRRSRGEVVVGESDSGWRREEGDEEADAVIEVGGVGADERRVVPRRGVGVVAEVEEEGQHGLAGAFPRGRRAEELGEEVRVPSAVGVGGEAVEEGEALGCDDVVAGAREAAGEGGDAGALGPAGGEAEHLACAAVVGGRVLVGGGAHDGDVETTITSSASALLGVGED